MYGRSEWRGLFVEESVQTNELGGVCTVYVAKQTKYKRSNGCLWLLALVSFGCASRSIDRSGSFVCLTLALAGFGLGTCPSFPSNPPLRVLGAAAARRGLGVLLRRRRVLRRRPIALPVAGLGLALATAGRLPLVVLLLGLPHASAAATTAARLRDPQIPITSPPSHHHARANLTTPSGGAPAWPRARGPAPAAAP